MTHKVIILTIAPGQYTANADRKEIDWHNSSDRKWLQSHLHWSIHNERHVEIYPQTH